MREKSTVVGKKGSKTFRSTSTDAAGEGRSGSAKLRFSLTGIHGACRRYRNRYCDSHDQCGLSLSIICQPTDCLLRLSVRAQSRRASLHPAGTLQGQWQAGEWPLGRQTCRAVHLQSRYHRYSVPANDPDRNTFHLQKPYIGTPWICPRHMADHR